MTRVWVLSILMLGVAGGLRAEDSAKNISGAANASANLSPSAAVIVDEPVVDAPWKEDGFEYCLGVTALSLFNASPLSFSPFELGWRFKNGLRLRGGIDLFYYEGLDSDAKLPGQGILNYSYEMRDIRLSLLYFVPIPGRLRPMAGLTLESVGGTRKLTGSGILNSPTINAWSFLGAGVVLGGGYQLSEHWAIETQGRYTFSFNAVGSVTALGLNMAYLF